jgi:hypothetical protein
MTRKHCKLKSQEITALMSEDEELLRLLMRAALRRPRSAYLRKSSQDRLLKLSPGSFPAGLPGVM